MPTSTWYETTTSLPVAHTADELRIAAARLRAVLANRGVTFDHLACEAIDAGPFNNQVNRMGSKAGVNWCAAMRHAATVMQRFGEHHPRIIIDRHGGRVHYREDLQYTFPDAAITVVIENETVSRYVLEEGPRRATISFVVESESRHLPVALASMTAKYVRELLMMRLNRFFAQHMPDLKPTAGYFKDGQRFIQDVEKVIQSLNLPRQELIRCV